MLLKIVDVLHSQSFLWVFQQKAVNEVLDLLASLWTHLFVLVFFAPNLIQKIPALNKLFVEGVFLVDESVYHNSQGPEVNGSCVFGAVQFFRTEVSYGPNNLLKIVAILWFDQSKVGNERIAFFIDKNVL